MPRTIVGDSAGFITARDWDSAKEPFAERVLDKLEAYAPGVRQRIIGRAIFSPTDLERDNPSLVGGDSVGGSHHLRQYFLFRPFPGASRYRLPIAGLLMTGAGTWPGGGTSGTSGYLAAQTLLRPAQLQRRLALGGAVVGGMAAALAGARRLLRQG